MNLKNKVIVITGADDGMGKATAELAAKKGAYVIIGARNKEKLSNVAKYSNNIIYKVTDVTKLADVKALVHLAISKFHRLDVIYNNAGIMPQGPIDAPKEKLWRETVQTNVMGLIHGITASLPIMERQKHGLIMATDSVAGHVIVPNSAVYTATKYSVKAIMATLRQEECSKGIKTGIISPGMTHTNLLSTVGNKKLHDLYAAQYKKRDMYLDPEDVARTAIFMMEQPSHVSINEILVRPTKQVF